MIALPRECRKREMRVVFARVEGVQKEYKKGYKKGYEKGALGH